MSVYSKEAKEKFEFLKNNKAKVYIIHYSCESFIKHQMKTPRISSIAIRNYGNGQTVTFSINKIAETKYIKFEDIESKYDELEKCMLEEYFEFIRVRKDNYYVHWNMRDINYGFEAIKHRYKVLGGKPVNIEENRLYDLSKILINYYGVDYISHPRMIKLMEKNNISTDKFLSGPEEAECFDNKDYIKLQMSTLKKVDILFNILDRQINGKLKTNKNELKAKIDEIFESSVCKVISILAAIWTLISIPLIFN